MLKKKGQALVPAVAVLFLLAAAACGPKQPALVAPSDVPKGPIPLFSALTPESDLAVHLKPETLFDVPLVQLGLDILKGEVAENAGLSLEDMKAQFGFDPIYDITEAFVTNRGEAFKDDIVILVRYGQEADLVAAVARVYAAIKHLPDPSSMRHGEIKGRKAVIMEEGGYAAVQVDPMTVAILKATEAEAKAWLEQMSRKNDNRTAIAKHLARLAGNEAFAEREPCIALYMDFTHTDYVSELEGTIDSEGMTIGAVQAAVARDVLVVAEAVYGNEEAAKKFAAELGKLFDSPPGALAFLREMFTQLKQGLKVETVESVVAVELTVPEQVLDTVYVILKMLLDVGQGMGAGVE
ncbi:MAG: hypothetical protein ABIJ56_00860 [Pseudomonadota bacterium]